MVSIIVPVFNVEGYLRKCIDSILEQTFTDIEVILIDDGSTDSSGEICDSYSDSRINVIHTLNHGLSSARNTGIAYAHGEYLFFVDGDDWIEAGILEQAVEKIGEADILCFCKNEGMCSGIEAMSAVINEKISMTTWGKLYKKDCFTAIRFPEGRIIEDVATTYKVMHYSDVVKCSNINGYHHVYREDSISNIHNTKNLIDCWLAVREQYEYCIDLVDENTQLNLLKHCATAISRAWGWRNSNTCSDSPEWEKMSVFARTMFPRKVRSSLSIRRRGGIFLAQFNNPLSFWIANKMHMLTRQKPNRIVTGRND